MIGGFSTPLSGTEFTERFPDSETLGAHFGHDLTDDTATSYYTNAAGEVGECRMDRSTTRHSFALLEGERAEIAVAYYSAKRARDARDATVLALIRPLLAQLSDGARRTLLGD